MAAGLHGYRAAWLLEGRIAGIATGLLVNRATWQPVYLCYLPSGLPEYMGTWHLPGHLATEPAYRLAGMPDYRATRMHSPPAYMIA